MIIRRVALILTILCNTFFVASGAGEHKPTGARSASLGGCSVTQSDIFACINNQAALASVRDFSAGSCFQKKWMLRDLNSGSLVLALPLKPGTLGFSFSNDGYSKFNESKLGLAYGMKLNEYLQVGVQLDYLQFSFSDIYKDKKTVTFEVGLLYSLNRNLMFGVHVYNPLNAELSKLTNEKISSSINLGAAYKVGNEFILYAEIKKCIHHEVNIMAGAEYSFTKLFYLRAGISTSPATYNIGVGIKTSKLIIDIASTTHQVLGTSPQISLAWKF